MCKLLLKKHDEAKEREVIHEERCKENFSIISSSKFLLISIVGYSDIKVKAQGTSALFDNNTNTRIDTQEFKTTKDMWRQYYFGDYFSNNLENEFIKERISIVDKKAETALSIMSDTKSSPVLFKITETISTTDHMTKQVNNLRLTRSIRIPRDHMNIKYLANSALCRFFRIYRSKASSV